MILYSISSDTNKQTNVSSEKMYINVIENVNFRIPQDEYYMYPTWLFLYIQVIIVPIVWLSAIATKILMKKEMKRYLFGNTVHPVHE